jgi:tetratricopeptide (TPR) repeat protein
VNSRTRTSSSLAARWLGIALLGVSLTFHPAMLHAQDPAPGGGLDQVRALVGRANAQFQVGAFAEALRLYREAYGLRAVPNILFNIGQCHRQLKEYDKAIFAYRNYLAAAPNAPNRADAEAIIAEVEAEKKAAQVVRAETSAAATPVLPSPRAEPVLDGPRPFYKTWWFWTVVGGVVAGAAIAGGVVGGSRTCARGAPGCP